jgi:hypothetical protein
MIRRGFWLAVGAAGGIMGYRRASSLARQVSATLGVRPERPGAVKRHWGRETIRFARDVRAGMDIYMARHPGPERPTLGANPGKASPGQASPGQASPGQASPGNASTRDDERVKDDR